MGPPQTGLTNTSKMIIYLRSLQYPKAILSVLCLEIPVTSQARVGGVTAKSLYFVESWLLVVLLCLCLPLKLR